MTLIIVSDLYLHLGIGLRANVWNVNSRMVNDYFEEIKIYDIYDYTLYLMEKSSFRGVPEECTDSTKTWFRWLLNYETCHNFSLSSRIIIYKSNFIIKLGILHELLIVFNKCELFPFRSAILDMLNSATWLIRMI